MPPPPATGRPRVVIVGAGFGGLAAARALAGAPVDVTLVDRRNHHLFQPLLYQVATAGLNPGDIAMPVRQVLRRQRNAEVVLGEVRGVELARKVVTLDDGELGVALPFDFLVVATGARHAYFGHPEWEAVAPGLKSVEDALEIRRRVFLAFERAERAVDQESREAFLTFVVVGAGPTGVELAGALAEIAAHTLVNDFRHIDPKKSRIVLVEGGPAVLGSFSAVSSARAAAALARLGVEVRTGARVTGVDDRGVRIGEAEHLPARTVLWAAGVRASRLGAALGAPLDGAGRVLVTERLTLPGHDDVFVLGDLAAVRSGAGFLPGVAQVAIQGGAYAARSIVARLGGRAPPAFRYRDKGTMATVGRAAAVAEIGRLRLGGLLAWLAWLLVHVAFLVGFRNRVAVILEWAFSYLTWEKGARLITGGPRPAPPPLASVTSLGGAARDEPR